MPRQPGGGVRCKLEREMSESEQSQAEPNWRRMAAPQQDGYDTNWALHLAETGGSPLRPLPYVRRPTDGAPTLFDGRVAVRRVPERGPFAERIVPADVHH